MTDFGIIKPGAKTLIDGESLSDEDSDDDDDSAVISIGSKGTSKQDASKAAIPRGLALVGSLVGNNDIKISAGQDDSLAIYELAADFIIVDSKNRFKKGWARRPLVGDLYGKSTMANYYEEVLSMVRKGVENKSDKMNPCQMHDTLWQKYGLYSLPSEHSIRLAISAMLEKIKKEKPSDKEPVKAKSKLTKKQQTVEAAMKDAMKVKLRQRGWVKMKPQALYDRLVCKQIGGKLSKRDVAALSKLIRAYWGVLKSQKKKKIEKLAKKELI